MRIATKLFEFEAAHLLPKYNGTCKNLHGHTYKLEVSVKQLSDELDGQCMIIDFADLKNIVMKAVIAKLDHKYINDIFTKIGIIRQPTAEVMVSWIVKQIQRELPLGINLYRVKLWETSNSYIEWRPHDLTGI
jgi:6-pyruvoyltetrahydropterin/6-carboxytetrahydropterin synthase